PLMNAANPADLVPAIHAAGRDRASLAALAPHVFVAAEAGDAVAQSIAETGADELAQMVVACAKSLEVEQFALALSGGLLIHSKHYRALVTDALERRGLRVEPVTIVAEPAEGAVKLAVEMAGTLTPTASR